MNDQQAREVFNKAADTADTPEQKTMIELLREYFTNDEFRGKLEQHTFENQKCTPMEFKETGNKLFPVSIPIPGGVLDGTDNWDNCEDKSVPIPPRKSIEIDFDGDEMAKARAWSEKMRSDLARD